MSTPSSGPARSAAQARREGDQAAMALWRQVVTARGMLAQHRGHPSGALVAARVELLRALEAYALSLEARGRPIPHAMHDELRIQRLTVGPLPIRNPDAQEFVFGADAEGQDARACGGGREWRIRRTAAGWRLEFREADDPAVTGAGLFGSLKGAQEAARRQIAGPRLPRGPKMV